MTQINAPKDARDLLTYEAPKLTVYAAGKTQTGSSVDPPEVTPFFNES